MIRLAGLVPSLCAAVIVTGCATEIPGRATPDPAAAQAHIECVRATNDAVVAVKSWLSNVDLLQFTEPDVVPVQQMRVACDGPEFVSAYSDFLTRIEGEFTPVTSWGRVAIRGLMNTLCRNDSPSGGKVDQLTPAAQEACRAG